MKTKKRPKGPKRIVKKKSKNENDDKDSQSQTVDTVPSGKNKNEIGFPTHFEEDYNNKTKNEFIPERKKTSQDKSINEKNNKRNEGTFNPADLNAPNSDLAVDDSGQPVL